MNIDNFIEIKKNIFLNKSDKRFYEKCLKFFPYNETFLLNAAKVCEDDGEIKKAHSFYKKILKSNPNSISARDGYNRTLPKGSIPETNNKNGALKALIIILIVSLILFILSLIAYARYNEISLFKFFIHDKSNFTVHLPVRKDVVGKITKNIVLEDDKQDSVTQALIKEAQNLRNIYPNASLEVKGFFGGHEFAYLKWVPNENGDIFFLKPQQESSNNIERGKLVLSALQSALYYYKKAEGHYPESLGELESPYPKNYLSSIPFEPVSKASNITDGYKGWNYIKPEEGISPMEALSSSIIPPIPYEGYGILSIIFDRANLYIVNEKGDPIKKYPIGFPKSNPYKPGEKMFVSRKLVINKKNSPFGTRVMELSGSDLAIHGTNDDGSIGKENTLGCIRMHNKDMEELYSLIPLNAVVTYDGHMKKSSEKLPLVYKINSPNDTESPVISKSWRN